MQAIANEYVQLAEVIAARLGEPRVRALHLPRAREADKDAEFCAVELEDGSIGFSYVRLDNVEHSMRSREVIGAAAGTPAARVARGYARSDPVARAIGFAAINALSQQLFSHADWLPAPARDSLGMIDPGPCMRVGMIGLFAPLVAPIIAVGARLTVLELRPDLAGEREGFRVTLDTRDIEGCESVLSTCAVLLNDTLDTVLAGCRNARHFAVVGPTAGCVPDPLFRRGVDAVCGRGVVNVDGFRRAFCAGEPWGRYARKYAIARSDYPGIEALLARVG